MLTNQHFLPLLSLVALTAASPVTAAKVSVSVDVYADTACAVPGREGYSFTRTTSASNSLSRKAASSLSPRMLSRRDGTPIARVYRRYHDQWLMRDAPPGSGQ